MTRYKEIQKEIRRLRRELRDEAKKNGDSKLAYYALCELDEADESISVWLLEKDNNND